MEGNPCAALKIQVPPETLTVFPSFSPDTNVEGFVRVCVSDSLGHQDQYPTGLAGGWLVQMGPQELSAPISHSQHFPVAHGRRSQSVHKSKGLSVLLRTRDKISVLWMSQNQQQHNIFINVYYIIFTLQYGLGLFSCKTSRKQDFWLSMREHKTEGLNSATLSYQNHHPSLQIILCIYVKVLFDQGEMREMQIENDRVNLTFLEVKYNKILFLPPFLHLQFYFPFHLIFGFEAILAGFLQRWEKWFLRHIKVEQRYWFLEVGNSLKNSMAMADGEVNKEDIYGNAWRGRSGLQG